MTTILLVIDMLTVPFTAVKKEDDYIHKSNKKKDSTADLKLL